MELVKLELDKGTKILVGLNFFLLISIVSGGVIHHLLRDFISVHVGVVTGLFIGLGAMIGTAYWFKKRKDDKNVNTD